MKLLRNAPGVDVSGTVIHNNTSGLQGGNLSERYHLTLAESLLVPNAEQSTNKGINNGL